MSSPIPAHCATDDTHSFGFSTCRTRWPKILDTCMKDVQLESQIDSSELKTSQSKKIIDEITSLLDEMNNDAEITPFSEEQIKLIPSLAAFNSELENFNTGKYAKEQPKNITWLAGPWLYIECYLYRRIDAIIKSQSEFFKFDIFNRLKRETFHSSSFGIYELAIRYKHLNEEISKKQAHGSDLDSEAVKLLFEEFIDVSLWGNATDLSLLANASLEDIKSVQGAQARADSQKNIICNDLPQVWEYLVSKTDSSSRRIDFVLDNAGFEFYTDLILTLFLLDSKFVNKVVFHCKTRPWMVSDTMIKDYQIFLDDMHDTSLFPEHREEMDFVVSQIEKYRKAGQFELRDSEFWTSCIDYWEISPEETNYGGSEVHKDLIDSDLVIFKGDLNYRKLTGDRNWKRSTPFVTGLNKLAHSGIKVLALRTCKADVCVGLPEGKDEELCKTWVEQGNEIGELWCSSGKWAVISFSEGK